MSTPLMTDSKVDAEQLQAFAMQMRGAGSHARGSRL
jgi:hypothetical protein